MKAPAIKILLCSVALLMVVSLAAMPASAVTGAGFTTFDTTLQGCLDSKNGINCNNYADKLDVYMNGGPTAGGIGPGNYYFTVLAPGSQNGGFIDGATGNLSSGGCGGGTATDRSFTKNADGTITNTGNHGNGTDPQPEPVIQLAPYCDTPNNGGVYIMAICTVGATNPSQCKYDAFRVPAGGPPASDKGILTACKYYDANANGAFDAATETLIDWAFKVDPIDSSLDPNPNTGSCVSWTLDAGPYTVQEGIPTQSNWINSDPGPNPTLLVPATTYIGKPATVVTGGVTEVDFGNYCTVASGGLTLGFWSNKNGQVLETQSDFAALTALNLVNANGTARDFTGTLTKNKSDLNSWLLSATATNMAYMLSAQLATMKLNVLHGFVNGNAFVTSVTWKGQTNAVNLTINGLIALANSTLGSPGGNLTVAQTALRTLEGQLENDLDGLNNGQPVVPGAGTCSATFDLTSFPLPPQ